MSRGALSCLVLPRLHPELISGPPPEGALFLWPGLPRPPESGVFIPPYPWTPAQAAACLADLERAGLDGARGAPVLSLCAAGLTGDPGLSADLSAGERRALRQFLRESRASGLREHAPDSPDWPDAPDPRLAAQQTLLLAWLQEKQLLELRELSRRVRRESAALAGLLGESPMPGPEPEKAAQVPDPPAPPPWRTVLAAAALFLPPPDRMAVLALDRDMGDSLAALAGDDGQDSPGGLRSALLPLDRVLGRTRSAGPGRDILFLYPANRV